VLLDNQGDSDIHGTAGISVLKPREWTLNAYARDSDASRNPSLGAAVESKWRDRVSALVWPGRPAAAARHLAHASRR
jgi:hypothetical protein